MQRFIFHSKKSLRCDTFLSCFQGQRCLRRPWTSAGMCTGLTGSRALSRGRFYHGASPSSHTLTPANLLPSALARQHPGTCRRLLCVCRMRENVCSLPSLPASFPIPLVSRLPRDSRKRWAPSEGRREGRGTCNTSPSCLPAGYPVQSIPSYTRVVQGQLGEDGLSDQLRGRTEAAWGETLRALRCT